MVLTSVSEHPSRHSALAMPGNTSAASAAMPAAEEPRHVLQTQMHARRMPVFRCGMHMQVESEEATAVLLAAEAAVTTLHVLSSPQMPSQVLPGNPSAHGRCFLQNRTHQTTLITCTGTMARMLPRALQAEVLELTCTQLNLCCLMRCTGRT